MPNKTLTRRAATLPCDDPLRSIPETARALSLTDATIRSWVWQRRIESIRVGRLVPRRLQKIGISKL